MRRIQEDTGGFTSFIPWIFAAENTALGKKVQEATAVDYLKTLAVSRMYLDNIDHIQSSWLTPGIKVCQVGLQFGADDVGSILIEENVVYAAGVRNRTNEERVAADYFGCGIYSGATRYALSLLRVEITVQITQGQIPTGKVVVVSELRFIALNLHPLKSAKGAAPDVLRGSGVGAYLVAAAVVPCSARNARAWVSCGRVWSASFQVDTNSVY